jgi:TetR/AcrR family transcriptional repressor of lmrAB and yxaGH operons
MAKSAEHASRVKMLETAIDLMRGYGLAGAGINDIVRVSGAPKGSVYHFFPDGKLQIAQEALDLHATRAREFCEAALAAQQSAPDKVRSLFAAFARRIEEARFLRSCPIATVCLDLGEENDALHATLAAAFDAWISVIEAHFDLGDARRTHSFATLVLTTIEGAYVMCRVQRSSRAFEQAGEWLAALVADAPKARRAAASPARRAPRARAGGAASARASAARRG